MVWTPPLTAVAGAVLTAAEWNTSVRDNLNETFPAKATRDGTLAVGTGVNSIEERFPDSDSVQTQQTTTSTSPTDLTTAGPAVTSTTGARAIVSLRTLAQNNTAGQTSLASYEISGATSTSASIVRAVSHESGTANEGTRVGLTNLFQTLTPGSNTFTMKYWVSGGTGSFAHREIVVVPL